MTIVVGLVRMLLENVWLLLFVGGFLGVMTYLISIVVFKVITVQELKSLLIRK